MDQDLRTKHVTCSGAIMTAWPPGDGMMNAGIGPFRELPGGGLRLGRPRPRLTATLKCTFISFYIAHHPVRWNAQSTLHFTAWQTCSFRYQLDFYGNHSAMLHTVQRLLNHGSKGGGGFEPGLT